MTTPARRARLCACALAVWAGLVAVLPAGAQVVEREGEGDAALDHRLTRLLQRDYLLVAQDTLIPASDTVRRPVLVLDARLTLEGTISSDVVGVDAEIFLRPSASVTGDVVNIAGGLYRSELATIAGSILDLPLVHYRVVREPGRLRIQGWLDPPSVELQGFLGFSAPTYDRVDALSLAWGGAYRLPALGRVEPRIHGQLGWRTGRGDPTGGLELSLTRGGTRLRVGGLATTITNEDWIKSDVNNTLSYFFVGRDYRDYYASEQRYVEVSRAFRARRLRGVLTLRGQREDARSLRAKDPWTFLAPDSVRFNPPISDGRISSLVLAATSNWTGQLSALELGASLEVAGSALDGRHSFRRHVVWGEWAMAALSDHTLEIEWRLMGPLPGTDSLPHQRWSFVGGSGTLQTFDLAQFPGDRVVFIETEYIIPLRLRLPLLGAPDLHLLHAAGMGWVRRTRRDLEQEIGLKLQFFAPFLRLLVNPANQEADFDVGLSLPAGARPWQRPQQ
ncbi:MAG: hypothetical protein HY561_04665 [Gemmatimonadetes bacterium]|nr:hypothetical protein [Gemmatimonadota bacterium]